MDLFGTDRGENGRCGSLGTLTQQCEIRVAQLPAHMAALPPSDVLLLCRPMEERAPEESSSQSEGRLHWNPDSISLGTLIPSPLSVPVFQSYAVPSATLREERGLGQGGLCEPGKGSFLCRWMADQVQRMSWRSGRQTQTAPDKMDLVISPPPTLPTVGLNEARVRVHDVPAPRCCWTCLENGVRDSLVLSKAPAVLGTHCFSPCPAAWGCSLGGGVPGLTPGHGGSAAS